MVRRRRAPGPGTCFRGRFPVAVWHFLKPSAAFGLALQVDAHVRDFEAEYLVIGGRELDVGDGLLARIVDLQNVAVPPPVPPQRLHTHGGSVGTQHAAPRGQSTAAFLALATRTSTKSPVFVEYPTTAGTSGRTRFSHTVSCVPDGYCQRQVHQGRGGGIHGRQRKAVRRALTAIGLPLAPTNLVYRTSYLRGRRETMSTGSDGPRRESEREGAGAESAAEAAGAAAVTLGSAHVRVVGDVAFAAQLFSDDSLAPAAFETIVSALDLHPLSEEIQERCHRHVATAAACQGHATGGLQAHT